MKNRHILVVMVPMMLLTLFFFNSPVKATAWDTISYCPSSVNDVWSEAGVNVSPPLNSWAIRELEPGFFIDMYSVAYVWKAVAVSNWSWIRYSGFEDPINYNNSHPPGGWGNTGIMPGGTISGTLGLNWSIIYNATTPNMPIAGDTIISVQAVAYWISFHTPYFYFTLYQNGMGSSPHNESTGFPAYYDGSPHMFAWNITTKRAWTYADFTDTDIALQITAEIYPGIHYYLDYIGLVIRYVAGPGHYGSPGYSLGEVWLDISGSFGVIGFIGMTVCPAYAVMQWRNGGDGRVARLLMSIVAMLVFFTLFIASLGA